MPSRREQARPGGAVEYRHQSSCFWTTVLYPKINGDVQLGIGIHPNPTSSTIITAKPHIVPIVAMSVFFSNCDSGISSSTTT